MILGVFLTLVGVTWLVLTYPIVGIPAVLVATAYLLGWFNE